MSVDITKILEYHVGSKLYGTDTPDSDIDIAGVFIAPIEYYFGLENIKELDMSIKSKDENNKNNKDAIDRKFYEIKRFINLATDNNPNIIEQLYIPENKLIYASEDGLKILNNKQLFLHKGLYYRFIGYAYSQKKKMIVKLDNYDEYIRIIDILNTLDSTAKLINFTDKLKNYIDNEFLKIGDIKVPLGVQTKKAIAIIKNRFESLSHRKSLVLKYGYDTKFASHLIRLVLEGIELLYTKNLIFPLEYADYIKDIKNGKYEMGQILEEFDILEKRLNKAQSESELPNYPDKTKINKLLIDILYNFHYKTKS